MTYRFDRFQFDRERGLFDDGAPISLEPQVHDLLSYLIDNRDRVVSRDELNEEIWDGRIVSDAALSTGIRSVRKALGDDRTKQSFVKTHPKRGFQFVATVENGSPDTAPSALSGRPAIEKLPLRFVAVALTIMAAAVIGAVVLVDNPAPTDRPDLSIAVLPFDNLSGDPTQDYFADAFTEDLITDLSRIRDAFVIARRSSFTYKDRSVDIKTVANELGVRYVLEGSVRREGDQVRINAQLIDGEADKHIWSDRYDRMQTEAFAPNNDVTGRIASALKAELREADSRRAIPDGDLEAWDYALRGNVELVQPDRDFHEAKELLEKAIELDPDIAAAWSGMAFIHFAASFGNLAGISAPNSKDLSLDAAQRSVELDPKNAEGHWMVGVGLTRNGETGLAMASCNTAKAINPNNDCAYVCEALTLMALGRPLEAVPVFEHSIRLNPRFRVFTKYKFMGVAYVQEGRDDKAIEVLNRALAESPKDPISHFALSAAMAHSGRLDEARASLQAALEFASNKDIRIHDLRKALGWMGPGTDRLLDGLALAGLPAT